MMHSGVYGEDGGEQHAVAEDEAVDEDLYEWFPASNCNPLKTIYEEGESSMCSDSEYTWTYTYSEYTYSEYSLTPTVAASYSLTPRTALPDDSDAHTETTPPLRAITPTSLLRIARTRLDMAIDMPPITVDADAQDLGQEPPTGPVDSVMPRVDQDRMDAVLEQLLHRSKTDVATPHNRTPTAANLTPRSEQTTGSAMSTSRGGACASAGAMCIPLGDTFIPTPKTTPANTPSHISVCTPICATPVDSSHPNNLAALSPIHLCQPGVRQPSASPFFLPITHPYSHGPPIPVYQAKREQPSVSMVKKGEKVSSWYASVRQRQSIVRRAVRRRSQAERGAVWQIEGGG
ncbi:unnamed protein product [Vitrella brassicaformis CCMP3155]|uniref:Uncharacterized protein n=1 Tax=Vitrella brassicaformis (strain CCMP3155) TaxID=1169540 RepID=A0A0G4EMV2_VITBC|nr:unnamed protein product [Vitrella brassicaformis CCMP3155]|eukprot:CEL98144.1 unnamed protein product [Vitrella brassicaformis CCMP3155]